MSDDVTPVRRHVGGMIISELMTPVLFGGTGFIPQAEGVGVEKGTPGGVQGPFGPIAVTAEPMEGIATVTVDPEDVALIAINNE